MTNPRVCHSRAALPRSTAAASPAAPVTATGFGRQPGIGEETATPGPKDECSLAADLDHAAAEDASAAHRTTRHLPHDQDSRLNDLALPQN
jgi:hypothetical protein